MTQGRVETFDEWLERIKATLKPETKLGVSLTKKERPVNG